MPTRIKICGVMRQQDAAISIELGAYALGFNFYPPSPRYINPAAARAIIDRLPPLVTTVGVFADESDAKSVLAVAHAAGVRVIQLHGPKWPQFDGRMAEFPVIRAVTVGPGFKAEALQSLNESAFLLDSYDPNLIGGTGKTFDWSVARDARKYGAMILAGGLKAENVGSAIRATRPYGVDVATGVESSSGVKDAAKLRAFFEAVREADATFE
jgi:phosphoribosylanthranilate isomerase